MNIILANDLRSGAVVWWTGVDWSIHVDEAVDVRGDGAAIIARGIAAGQIASAEVVTATRTDGHVVPDHIKDRIRGIGPTVRPDLAVPDADPAAGNWTI